MTAATTSSSTIDPLSPPDMDPDALLRLAGRTASHRDWRVTGAGVIRATGLAAILAGIIFAAIQPIHPADVPASVTTVYWAVIIVLKFIMCLLFLFSTAGLCARQVEEVGWLGLAGALLFSLCWMLQIGYVFTELFVLPVMATAAPPFVSSFLAIVSGTPGEMNIGALVPVYGLLGVLYLLGGLSLGVATFRAGILPRGPAGLLAVTALLTPLAVLLPHEVQRLAGVPMGIAFAWLGYALWSERSVVTP
jgi:hypothetical protein